MPRPLTAVLEEGQAYQKIMILDNLKCTTFIALDIKLCRTDRLSDSKKFLD